ncbi:MAG: polyphosphate kinase 1 [Spirochaetaceae bacterium]|nr:polyphosphate kinase 1 [Spirochaetaceae bacterium]
MKDNHFIQRELSWNAFNARVMNEALRDDLRLLDRLKFMAITSSNYDEFFMVRVARLMREAASGDHPASPEEPRPSEILVELLSNIRSIVETQDETMTQDILPSLAKEGLVILHPEDWDNDIRSRARRIFEDEIFPVATPQAITKDRPLDDLLAQTRLYTAFTLDGDDLALIRLPDNIERFQDYKVTSDNREILLLEDILMDYASRYFPGRTIQSTCCFRITRDADMTVDEERDEDFVAAMEEVLESRKNSFIVRLESRGEERLATCLREALDLPLSNHFHLEGPLDLKAFFHIVFIRGFDNLRDNLPAAQSAADVPENEDFWEVLKDRNILLHHPYESYTPVVRMVELAADDPSTLAIKMTLYRTSGDSPIAKALIRAAERGVQVTVLVELKARFDEGANINWASRLEQAGAIVVQGLAVLKVHAKALMIVKKEDEGIRRYVHLGTGNYNDSTAKLYTDLGYITSRDEFTRDVTLFFNAITGYSSEPQLKTLIMAPFSLRRETLRLIQREEERARGGEEARIIAKMNSLVDPEIIEALYSASSAGVRVDLNVRGICCLRPGVKGMSENIRVVSIIDTFLEHTRAFIYMNGGHHEVYLSSADWMTRNLDRRVELLFPIVDPDHSIRIRAILDAYFRDNCRSWHLGSDGQWTKQVPARGEKRFRVQDSFALQAVRSAVSREDEEKKALRIRRKPPRSG